MPGWMRAKQEPLVIQMGSSAISSGIYAAGKMMSSETFCIHPTPGRRIRNIRNPWTRMDALIPASANKPNGGR